MVMGSRNCVLRRIEAGESVDGMRAVLAARYTCHSGCTHPKNLGLMRRLSNHFNGHHPIERDSHETDGVLMVRMNDFINCPVFESITAKCISPTGNGGLCAPV